MRLQVAITLNSNAGARTEMRDLDVTSGINVSNPGEVVSMTTPKGFRGFQLSDDEGHIASRLNNGYKFFPDTGYSGYISQDITDAQGEIDTVSFPFYVVGSGDVFLTILFDPLGENYAVNFEIRNYMDQQVAYVYNNRRKSVSVTIPATGMYFTLKVRKWSKPYSSVIISRITAPQSLVFTGKDIESCEWSEASFDAQMTITPGIVEQYADIVIYDRDGNLHNYAQDNDSGSSEHKVTVHSHDGDQSILQGAYIITSWDIPGDSSKIKLLCSDLSPSLDKINIKSFPVANRTVDDMLTFLFVRAGNLPWKYQNSDISSECKSIATPDSWFVPCTLLQLLNKICVLGLLRIYWDTNSFVVARCW